MRTSVVITGLGRLDNNKVVIQDSKREKKLVAEKISESQSYMKLGNCV